MVPASRPSIHHRDRSQPGPTRQGFSIYPRPEEYRNTSAWDIAIRSRSRLYSYDLADKHDTSSPQSGILFHWLRLQVLYRAVDRNTVSGSTNYGDYRFDFQRLSHLDLELHYGALCIVHFESGTHPNHHHGIWHTNMTCIITFASSGPDVS